VEGVTLVDLETLLKTCDIYKEIALSQLSQEELNK